MTSRALPVVFALGVLLAAPAVRAEPDGPVRQVQIEAKIVEASVSFTRELGVYMGFTGAGDGAGGYDPDGPLFDPTASPDGIWLGNLADFGSGLPALQRDEDTRVLADPKIVTETNRRATIFDSQIPFVGGDGDDFEPPQIQIELRVMPLLTADDRLHLELGVDSTILDAAGAPPAVPMLEPRRAETRVILPDAGTVLIGGLLRDWAETPDDELPGLSQIPYLGRLFRSGGDDAEKRTLLIFVTARLVGELGTSRGGGYRPTGTRQQPVHRPRPDTNLDHPPNVPVQPNVRPGYRRN